MSNCAKLQKNVLNFYDWYFLNANYRTKIVHSFSFKYPISSKFEHFNAIKNCILCTYSIILNFCIKTTNQQEACKILKTLYQNKNCIHFSQQNNLYIFVIWIWYIKIHKDYIFKLFKREKNVATLSHPKLCLHHSRLYSILHVKSCTIYTNI